MQYYDHVRNSTYRMAVLDLTKPIRSLTVTYSWTGVTGRVDHSVSQTPWWSAGAYVEGLVYALPCAHCVGNGYNTEIVASDHDPKYTTGWDPTPAVSNAAETITWTLLTDDGSLIPAQQLQFRSYAGVWVDFGPGDGADLVATGEVSAGVTATPTAIDVTVNY